MSADNQEPTDMFLPSATTDSLTPDTQSQNDNLAGLFGVGDGTPIEVRSPSVLKSRSVGMLLVVLVAGGTLMIMRQFGLGSRLKLVDIKISYPLDNARKADVFKHQRMLADLRDSSDAPQVPLKDVKKNPFLLGLQSDIAAAPDKKPSTPFDQEEFERQQRMQLIQTTFDGLRLNSVVGGAVSVARISGKSVRVGDSVAGLFVVKAIHGRTVELSADDVVYELVIGK
jgi:hypothetical protein